MRGSLRFALGVLCVAALPAVAQAGGPPRSEGPAPGDPELDAQMGDGLRSYTEPFDRLQSDLPSPRATVCADGATTFGIDVSHWQGAIDWPAVAADGVEYAFVRVSDGLGTNDSYFATNLAQSRANGIHTGVYQFFRPSQDPVAQADLLVDGIGTLEPGDLPPVIDVEATGGLSPAQVTAAVQAWIDRVESRLGVTPIIYSGKYFWQDNVQSTAFASYPLWAAHYTTAGCPNIADQWADWTFWQYTDSGSVAGVTGNVDSNEFNGDLTALVELTVGGAGECGDGTCNLGENTSNCIEDCPPCAVIPPSGLTIDEQDACFFAGGDPQYWRDESVGYADHHWWTYATASANPANYGVWDLHFEQAGDYELSVYVEAGAGTSTQSSYQISHGSSSSEVTVDQSGVSGWVSLGEYPFAAGGGQQVRIDDNSGEDWSLQLKIVVDALRVEPAGGSSSGTAGTTATTDSGDTSDTSDDSGSTVTSGPTDTGDTGTGSGSSESSGDESGGVSTGETGESGLPVGEGGDDKGCGCSSGDDSPRWSLALLALLGLGRTRRRRLD